VKVSVLTSSWPRHEGDPGGEFVRQSCLALQGEGCRLSVHSIEPGVDLVGARMQPLSGGFGGQRGAMLGRLKRRPWLAAPLAKALMAALPSLVSADRVLCHWAFPFPLLAQARGVAPERLRTWCHGSALRLPLAGALLGKSHPLALVDAHQRALVPKRFHRDLSLLPVPIKQVEKIDTAAQECLVFVGRLTAQKGVHILPSILDHLPGWTAVVVGDGPLRPQLESDARISCLGALAPDEWQQRVPLGVGVCPARGSEGSPLVVDELRSLGLPVVVAAQKGLAGRVQHQQNGLIERSLSPQAWAHSVRQAYENHELLSRHGAQGRDASKAWSPFLSWVTG
jgi:glycosyltransferase involved in cell wall biosynthesis